jgi:hypothetical protein
MCVWLRWCHLPWQMRRAVQSDPSSLGAVIQAVAAARPDLMGLIVANQAAFVEMLNEAPDDELVGLSRRRACMYRRVFHWRVSLQG